MGTKFHYKLFALLLALNILTLFLFNQFLAHQQSCECIPIVDSLQQSLSPRNFSIILSPLTYLPVILFLIFSLKKPQRLNFFAVAYILIICTRMFTIYFYPFCEPTGAIRLEDGILNTIFYPNGYCALDLFYSGHTATIFMLGLISPKPYRTILIVLSLVVGTLLVIQRVHYSIDVIVAFPMTLFCFEATKRIYKLICKDYFSN